MIWTLPGAADNRTGPRIVSEKVKDRILEILAVRKLSPDVKAQDRSVWQALRVWVRPVWLVPSPRALGANMCA